MHERISASSLETHLKEESLGFYFSEHSVHLIVVVSLFIATVGIIVNIMVLIFFLTVMQTRRIQSALWSNVSLSCFVKSLVLIYIVAGDLFLELSNSEQKCRFRYALPQSVDIVCISCFMMLILERLFALHCYGVYTVVAKIETMIIMFGWTYGISFFLFVVLKFQVYDSPVECKTPYTHTTPADPVQFISFMSSFTLLIISGSSLFLLYPPSMSHMSKLRLHVEMAGTTVVLIYGCIIIILWLPRQIVTCLFWFNIIDHAKYQIASEITTICMDLTVLLPFVVLLTRIEFRAYIYCMFTCNSMEPLKRKMLAQDNYINTIRKLVNSEKKSSIASTKQKQQYDPFGDYNSVALAHHAPVYEAVQAPPLEARSEFGVIEDQLNIPLNTTSV